MPKCPVCSHDNPGSALFCARCTSPVAVAPLHELDERDHRRCLAALFEVLAEESRRAATSPAAGAALADPELFGAYLNAFWLRPETALVLYGEALAVGSFRERAAGPWLDLGCGDGIHAALYSGWRFGETFDAFSGLDLAAADMYNRFDPAEFAAPVKRPGRRVEHGIDIKPTAVARAKALGAFADVRQADATDLPLEDGSVAGIFSNMLRDLGEPLPAALGECRRVLRDEGVLLLSAMTPAYPRHLYFASAARAVAAEGRAEEAGHLLRLDRGRSVFCQRQLTEAGWRELLGAAGLRLQATHACVGERAIRFWDVGLRPFVHALLERREGLRERGLLEGVKPMMVDGLRYFLAPLACDVAEGASCIQILEVRKA